MSDFDARRANFFSYHDRLTGMDIACTDSANPTRYCFETTREIVGKLSDTGGTIEDLFTASPIPRVHSTDQADPDLNADDELEVKP